ncbi:ferritin-like domain-containing protein [Streptacidiphilus sp. PB12-B1b]|uniref:ferritin-like domain-containing protein n=1 Tax=Streptacidiphilus sp. PB12-B1b TaxID=2705012 RepID=UPI0015FE749C|nr:ferritin-like domain-containing protein [Streptacidiphilus sp. PB12-B1b]QMU78019.1 ferritin-like domain-containing protein [Streptacidiphilus sp. PB12-B1b]
MSALPPSRRSFVRCAAVLGAGLALDACSGSHPAPPPYTGELRTVALAAALENQAVNAYRSVQAALRSGRLGPAVPALDAFVRTAMDHHAQHAVTWNAILRDARRPAVTGTPLAGHARLMDAIGAATSVAGIVAVVQRLENQAAQTHLAAAGSLAGPGPSVLAAATIAPVEAMHAAALGYVLSGRSAVGGFLGTAAAVPVTELTA